MTFDWSSPNPVTLESVLSYFNHCDDISDVRKVARRLVRDYYPDDLKGNEPYTQQHCINLINIVQEIVKGFEKNTYQYMSMISQDSTQSILDYAALRQRFTLKEWRDFWDDNLSYGQNVQRILSYFVVLPDSSLQLPIIAAFCCQNTALVNATNTLFLFSRKAGSGKSTVAEIISALQGSLKTDDDDPDGMSQTGTFVSIRNFISHNRIKRLDDGKPERNPLTRRPLEKNLFLVLDDFPESKLKDEDFYNILKAYKRNSAYISKSERIKDEDGRWIDSIVSFNVFCCKVLTSCYQIFSNPDYQELTRRCLFVKCQPFEDIVIESDEDKEIMWSNPLLNGDELYKPSEVDWKGVVDKYYDAWNLDAVERFHEALRKLKKPKGVLSSQWEITKELTASGYTLGVWDSLHEATEDVKAYWLWFNKQSLDSRTGTELVLQHSIENWKIASDDETENVPILADGTKNQYYPMHVDYIDPRWIEAYLTRAKKKSELDREPSLKVRNEIMLILGYKLRRINNKNYYCPIE